MRESALPSVYPTLWYRDVGVAVAFLIRFGFRETWRHEQDGVVEHAELRWRGGMLSLSYRRQEYEKMGPAGVALRVDERAEVDALYEAALAADAELARPLEEGFVGYGFTVRDPEGNLLWFHVETGNLDALRGA